MNFKGFSPSRSSIREANDHLQALYKRVDDLEQTVKEQAESMIKKDEQMQTALKEVSQHKDKEITELRKTLESSEAQLQRLLATTREKDAQIAHLLSKCQLLDDICITKPALEKLLSAFEKVESFSRGSSSYVSAKLHSSYKENNALQNNTRHFSISDDEADSVDGSENGVSS
ncbi:vimentin-type intermediate filament-associated coiled-coil protein-like [Glandiceps talaboti]